MRIKLKKDKQKELLMLAKKDKSWKELANILKLNENYLLNEVRKEKRLISLKTYKKLCKIANNNYNNYITEKLPDNWGKFKGGKNSKGNTKEIRLPKKSIELAEFYGIMLGDGNLTRIKKHKVGVYQIRIVGDSRNDKEYLLNYVKPLIEKLFNMEVKVSKQKDINALKLTSTGRKLVEFLESIGFKPGDKIRNQLDIPLWIKENEKFLKSCLRGLYDTDGSVYKLTNQNVFQFSFRNYNITLMKSVRESLLSLDINPSKITKGNEITITKKSELRKFLKDIGFSNIKHLNKAQMWNLSPVE